MALFVDGSGHRCCLLSSNSVVKFLTGMASYNIWFVVEQTDLLTRYKSKDFPKEFLLLFHCVDFSKIQYSLHKLNFSQVHAFCGTLSLNINTRSFTSASRLGWNCERRTTFTSFFPPHSLSFSFLTFHFIRILELSLFHC